VTVTVMTPFEKLDDPPLPDEIDPEAAELETE
jgi:hypothetical protein